MDRNVFELRQGIGHLPFPFIGQAVGRKRREGPKRVLGARAFGPAHDGLEARFPCLGQGAIVRLIPVIVPTQPVSIVDCELAAAPHLIVEPA